jgi:signal transduction histidine kinase
MKTKVLDGTVEVLRSLLGEARAEADGLRTRLRQVEQILLSTRLIMGHELKKPTTAISGYLDLALEDLKDGASDAASENVTKARGECDLLVELNAFFLELVKVNSVDEVMQGSRVDLRSFVMDTIKHFPSVLNAQGRVKTRLSPHIQDFRINSNAFKIILANIVENALKYSPADSEVLVDVRRIPDKRGMQQRDILQIKVQDRGLGVPAKEIDRVFAPFVRLREDVAEGSGLGLTLVRSLVELYGGDIHIKSTQGNTTTVYVTIPEAAEPDNASKKE